MGLFDRKKEISSACNCLGKDAPVEQEQKNTAAVKILGSGCAKCSQLEENTAEALKRLGLDARIEHIRDYADIAAYGVMSTPALVYNGKVLAYGKVLKTEEIINLLQKEG